MAVFHAGLSFFSRFLVDGSYLGTFADQEKLSACRQLKFYFNSVCLCQKHSNEVGLMKAPVLRRKLSNNLFEWVFDKPANILKVLL
jgi:hypothetical protein